MISPSSCDHLPIERRGIILNSTHVINEEIISVLLLDEVRYLIDVVTVPVLPAGGRRREAHGNDSRGYVG